MVLPNLIERLGERPRMVCQPGGQHPPSGFTWLPWTPAEIVKRDEVRDSGFQVFQLLREPQGQPGEPLHQGSDRQIVPLDVAGANVARGEVAEHYPSIGAHHFRRDDSGIRPCDAVELRVFTTNLCPIGGASYDQNRA